MNMLRSFLVIFFNEFFKIVESTLLVVEKSRISLFEINVSLAQFFFLVIM
jgi:hypothetical protein